MKFKLDRRRVEELHDRLEKLAVCLPGIRDENALESAIGGQQWYDNIFDQFMHVGSSINASHVFVDGNKRTSYMVIKELCDYRYYFDDQKLSDLIIALGNSEITKEEFMQKAKETLYVGDDND